jgi:hypothetical protein
MAIFFLVGPVSAFVLLVPREEYIAIWVQTFFPSAGRVYIDTCSQLCHNPSGCSNSRGPRRRDTSDPSCLRISYKLCYDHLSLRQSTYSHCSHASVLCRSTCLFSRLHQDITMVMFTQSLEYNAQNPGDDEHWQASIRVLSRQ